jgi:hypothetical protein
VRATQPQGGQKLEDGRVKKEIRTRAVIAMGSAITIAAFSLLSIGAAHAGSTKKKAAPTEEIPAPVAAALASESSRLNAIAGQVTNLQKASDDQTSETKKIEAAINVAPPADANAKPATVGEHVGVLEKDYGDFKTQIQNDLGVKIHGLVDAGWGYNMNKPVAVPGTGGPQAGTAGSNQNQLRVFDLSSGFNLTQGNLHIEKDGTVGFVADLNVGQVANAVSAATRYSNGFPVGSQYFDPTQFYLTYTAPIGSGLNIQAGRFVTLLGAETINTYNNLNFNESKSFIFGFGIPFTHTGIRGNYTFNDYIAFTGGMNNGWDDIAANNYDPSFEGELDLHTKEKDVQLLLNGIWGAQQVNQSSSKLGAIDPVFIYKPGFLKGVTLESEYLFASQNSPLSVFPFVSSNGNSLIGTSTLIHKASWQGFAQYVVWDMNDAIEFALRGEVFRDANGARTGIRQTVWEVTPTVNYKVPGVTGLLARGEYRHDESDNAKPFYSGQGFNGATGVPFHTYSGQDTLQAALIYAF